MFFFFFSSRRRHTRFDCDWSSDVCSSDLVHDCGGIRKNSATRQTRPPHRNSAKERYVIIAFVICAAYTSTEGDRSEERRVGKECRARWWADHEKEKRERKKS